MTDDTIVQRCRQVRGVAGAVLMVGPLGTAAASLWTSPGCNSATLYTRFTGAVDLRLLRKYHTAAATISPPPITLPTAIPASAPAESPPEEDEPPSLPATRVLVGPPVAVEQYADPLNEVHAAPLLQHPLPSEHLNWFVVQLPVTAGTTPGGGFVLTKTQFLSSWQLVSNGQQLPPSDLAQRYWLVPGQERPQHPVMTDVDLLVMVVSFP